MVHLNCPLNTTHAQYQIFSEMCGNVLKHKTEYGKGKCGTNGVTPEQHACAVPIFVKKTQVLGVE